MEMEMEMGHYLRKYVVDSMPRDLPRGMLPVG